MADITFLYRAARLLASQADCLAGEYVATGRTTTDFCRRYTCMIDAFSELDKQLEDVGVKRDEHPILANSLQRVEDVRKEINQALEDMIRRVAHG